MAENNNPNDPNATPDFDNWGPDTYWNKTDWMTWHAALVNVFGEAVGSDKWTDTWNEESDFLTWNAGDERADWVTLDPVFRVWLSSYTLSNGINMLESLQAEIFLGQTIGTATDITGNVLEGVSSLGSGVENTLKLASWLLPVVLVIVLACAGYIIYKKANI
jgi:hypothetical protein